MLWHVLDVRETCIREFAAALARKCDVVAWMPTIGLVGRFERWEHDDTLGDPVLNVVRFPMQRGRLFGEHRRMHARLLRRSPEPSRAALVCTLPHYAPVAEAWPGPVIYYVTDLFPAFDGWAPARILPLEQRLCAAAALVCPNSERIADHLVRDAGCAPGKIAIIPNATRAASILTAPPDGPAPLPAAIADLPRPVAGIIGNLGSNTDWPLVRTAVDATPWLSWAFVGPHTTPSAFPATSRRVRFPGAVPYGALRDYARAFDVAVLPYRHREPTYSGSSTRFYEHLAATRPILATTGCAELLSKTSFLDLIAAPAELVRALSTLRDTGFRDGRERQRWYASTEATWDRRAASMRAALEYRLSA